MRSGEIDPQLTDNERVRRLHSKRSPMARSRRRTCNRSALPPTPSIFSRGDSAADICKCSGRHAYKAPDCRAAMSLSERVETKAGGVGSSHEPRRDARVDYPIAHRLRRVRIYGRFNPLSVRRPHTLAQLSPSHQDTDGDRALPEGRTAVSHHTDTHVVEGGARLKVVDLYAFPVEPAQRVVATPPPRRTASLRWRRHTARRGAGEPSVCCKGSGYLRPAVRANSSPTPSSPRPSAPPAGRAPTIGPAGVAVELRNDLLAAQTAPTLLRGPALGHRDSRHVRCRHVQNEEKRS